MKMSVIIRPTATTQTTAVLHGYIVLTAASLLCKKRTKITRQMSQSVQVGASARRRFVSHVCNEIFILSVRFRTTASYIMHVRNLATLLVTIGFNLQYLTFVMLIIVMCRVISGTHIKMKTLLLTVYVISCKTLGCRTCTYGIHVFLCMINRCFNMILHLTIAVFARIVSSNFATFPRQCMTGSGTCFCAWNLDTMSQRVQ